MEGGELKVEYVHVDGGVMSGKAPFVKNGILRVFRVEGGHVQTVLLRLELPARPYSHRGKRYKVQTP